MHVISTPVPGTGQTPPWFRGIYSLDLKLGFLEVAIQTLEEPHPGLMHRCGLFCGVYLVFVGLLCGPRGIRGLYGFRGLGSPQNLEMRGLLTHFVCWAQWVVSPHRLHI